MMTLHFLSIILITIFNLHIAITDSCTDSSNHNECDFCLYQTDFHFGTYRMTVSGLYCIEENIIFNPIPGNINFPNTPGAWFPSNDTHYSGCINLNDGAYALGFFAVLSIETSNITLDLNGHKIEYHKYFYLQQRFGSIIEISNQPFLPNSGPAGFGNSFVNVQNISIRNGELGLTSHHGIHSNNASHVTITNLSIHAFEVAAIQFNGFNNVYLSNLHIGPSLQTVPLTGYYSNARFLLLALRRLLHEMEANQLEIPSISFSYLADDAALTLDEIHNNLVNAMDLMLRHTIDQTLITESERQSALFQQSLDLFKNHHLMPDGSALYGIVLNSFNVAVNGFGDSDNNGMRKGQNIIIENVVIEDLKLRVNQVNAMYFDSCEDSDAQSVTVLKGPFGDVLDIKKMIHPDVVHLIDEYGANSNGFALNRVKYIGNPLSDAQIALFLYKDYITNGNDYGFGSYLSSYFIDWALDETVSLPTCVALKCDSDIMLHTNKGIVGLRMDGIENAQIRNIDITHLENTSPFVWYSCGNDETGSLAMSSDSRALSVTDSDLNVFGMNHITDISSWNGNAIGIDLMEYASVDDDGSVLYIDGISAATKLSSTQYEQQLLDIELHACNISIDDTSHVIVNENTDSLEHNDCEVVTVSSNNVEYPNVCDDRCDAFSVLLSDRQYIADSVCLTYHVERLHETGFCRHNMQYIVLLLCDEDVYDTNTTCGVDDLNGIIEAVYDANGKTLHSWATTVMKRVGIRVNLAVKEQDEFTICLRDVWRNSVNDISHTISMKRGRTTFICNEEYVMGLPCIHPYKFEGGAYSFTGFNRKFAKYGVDKHNKYKPPRDNAMNIAQVTNAITGDIDASGTAAWVLVISVIVAIVFCVVLCRFKHIICNCGAKRKSYEKAETTMHESDDDQDREDENIIRDGTEIQMNIRTDGHDCESTQYEEVYCDASKTKTI
eukprot:581272_1